MVLLLPHHEPWADEAQAWQLARYANLGQLFSRLLHFEITPGLWHLLLHAEAAMGVSYTGMHWITAGIEAAAVAVLLCRAPFPLWLRVALPFTFFLAFQYAVVARSYSLCPLLVFLLAAYWEQRIERPLVIAALMALLANTCAQEMVVVMGLTLVLGTEMWKRRDTVSKKPWRYVLAGGLVLVSVAFAGWCCKSPPDAPWVAATQTWLHGGTVAPKGVQLPKWQLWIRLLEVALHGRANDFKVALSGGLARPTVLGLPVWISFAFHFGRRRLLRYFWPVALLAFFGTFTRFSPYHQGLMWLLALFLLWTTWPEREDVSHRFVVASIALCTAVQLCWTFSVTRREFSGPYAPTTAGVAALSGYLAQGTRVDLAIPAQIGPGTAPAFFAVALQPFFASQPFANVTYRYWSWVGNASAHDRYIIDSEQHSAVVMVVEYLGREHQDTARLLALGYHQEHRFCATNIYPKRYPVEEVCYSFYVPPGHMPAATSSAGVRGEEARP